MRNPDAQHAPIQSGAEVLTPSLKNHKNIGSLSNTGSDPLKNHKTTEPAFHVGPSSARQRNMAFPWRADDGPLIVVFHSSLLHVIKVVSVGPSPTKLSGSAHAQYVLALALYHTKCVVSVTLVG